jgi:hypothetical protein
VNIGRRPKFPEGVPPQLVAIVERCWAQVAKTRPKFPAVVAWQGLTLVHFSAQRERILWYRGCVQALFWGSLSGA